MTAPEIRPGDRVVLRGTVTGIYDGSSALVEVDRDPGNSDRELPDGGWVEVPLAMLDPDPETVSN